MKDKIYRNREVLRGKTFNARILSEDHEFTIMYVTDRLVNISKSIAYKEMYATNRNSLYKEIKGTILDNSASGSGLTLDERTFASRSRLKRVPIVIDDLTFNFANIFTSGIRIDMSIDLDDLLEGEDGTFMGDVRNAVLDNLLDNPPKVRKSGYDGFSWNLPYLFNDGGNAMYFTSVGRQRKVVSDVELERNRERFKKQHEEEKLKREKGRKLNEELGFNNKKSHTRDLARYR